MPLSSKRIAHSVLWLTGAEMISRLLVFFAVVRLTNFLGSSAYGELSYGFALANLIVVVADFGLANYAVRELARQLQHDPSTIKKLLTFKFGLSVLAVAAIMGIGLIATHLSPLIIFGGGVAIVLTNLRLFFEALFRAQGRMWLEAITKLLHAGLLTGIILYCIGVGANTTTVALGYALAATIMVGLGYGLIIVVTPLAWPWWGKPSLGLVKHTWPFALSLAINAQFNYLDSTMLGWWQPLPVVGWYSAAYKPIFFMTALAGMIINAFLPTIVRQFHHERTTLAATVAQLLRANLMLALPLAVGGTLLAPAIIAWLYKPEFAPAVLAFQILLWSTVGIFIWAAFGNTLQVCGHERDYLKNFALALVVTVLGNIILIRYFSLYGAAVATLCTQVTLVVLMYRSYRRLAPPLPLGSALIKIIAAAAIMGVVLLWLPPSLPVFVSVGLGGVSYLVALFGLRVVTVKELQQLYVRS